MFTPDDRRLLESLGARILDEAEGRDVALAIVEQAFPWAASLDLVVLLDEHTSDYPARIGTGRLAGSIVHLRHDDAPVVLCRDLAAYVRCVHETQALPRDTLLDPDRPSDADEEAFAQQLVALAIDEDDWAARALAIPLITDNVGLLELLAEDPDVAGMAAQRLAERAEVPTAPPWPDPPDLVRPEQEERLREWRASCEGIWSATIEKGLVVEMAGEQRRLQLHEPLDLNAHLLLRLPYEPVGFGLFTASGRWADGPTDGKLHLTPARVHLELADGTFTWTRES